MKLHIKMLKQYEPCILWCDLDIKAKASIVKQTLSLLINSLLRLIGRAN